MYSAFGLIDAEEESVVSVFPNTRRKLHTTRSWDFLKMPIGVRRHSNIESHIIVGMLDTGKLSINLYMENIYFSNN